jgi:hypothetical protein
MADIPTKFQDRTNDNPKPLANAQQDSDGTILPLRSCCNHSNKAIAGSSLIITDYDAKNIIAKCNICKVFFYWPRQKYI